MTAKMMSQGETNTWYPSFHVGLPEKEVTLNPVVNPGRQHPITLSKEYQYGEEITAEDRQRILEDLKRFCDFNMDGAKITDGGVVFCVPFSRP